jgi:molybdopterin-guanine dinucleotide biosynthesis protein A
LIDDIDHQTLDVPSKWKVQLQNVNTQEEYKNIIKK